MQGWHKPLRVLPELGNPAPPGNRSQHPCCCDTALSRRIPPPASLGAVREGLVVSHQPSMPDPTQLRGGVSTSVTSDGRFSPASASLPSLLFSPPATGRQHSRVSRLIQPAGGMPGRAGEWGWYLLGSEGEHSGSFYVHGGCATCPVPAAPEGRAETRREQIPCSGNSLRRGSVKGRGAGGCLLARE